MTVCFNRLGDLLSFVRFQSIMFNQLEGGSNPPGGFRKKGATETG